MPIISGRGPAIPGLNVYDDGRISEGTIKIFSSLFSGVDSYSVHPGIRERGFESYLYTAEAFECILSRLGPNVILNVMRMEPPLPGSMGCASSPPPSPR